MSSRSQDDLIIKGYTDGFTETLEKKGFLGFLAKSWLARSLAPKLGEGAINAPTNFHKNLNTIDFVQAQAPSVIEILSKPDGVDKLEEQKNDKELTDKKIEQLAFQVGNELPDELRRELVDDPVFRQLTAQLAEREHGQVAFSPTGVFRH